MREYRIKKGHNQDIGALINKFFGAKGNITTGIKFEVEGIGKIDMKKNIRNHFPKTQIIGGNLSTGDATKR